MFATLEPCAPGARQHPKTDCAERIRLARIKEVWVGIQDPDPKVARKGLVYLEENGIVVHMFDRDLQEVIEKENREFLRQAMERAGAIIEKKKSGVLSSLENKLPAAKLADFSEEALVFYRTTAQIPDKVGTEEFNRRFLQQGLLKEEGKYLFPTGFGILLFGKEPRRAMRQAGLLAIIHYPNGKKERNEFDEPIVMIPGLLEKWLINKLPNVFDRNKMQREEQPALPFEMVREAVVNALIHRDYSIKGGKCQVIVTEDTVTVKSPGGPPSPITVEQLQKFTAPMLSRNPELHFVFARLDLAEEQGLGLSSLRDKAKEVGLPLPKYAWEAPYLVLTLYRSMDAAWRVLGSQVLKSLSKAEQKGWQWLSTQETITASGYAAACSIPKRTALNHFKRFSDLGLICRIDTGRSTKYEITK